MKAEVINADTASEVAKGDAIKTTTTEAKAVEATDKPVAVRVTAKQGDYVCEGIRFTAKPFQFYAPPALVEVLSKDANLVVEVI